MNPGVEVMGVQIRVNPIECKAHGLCAEMLPEWIELDEWGYPILDGADLPDQLAARSARSTRLSHPRDRPHDAPPPDPPVSWATGSLPTQPPSEGPS